jgi:hypothetical protein
VTRNPPCGAYPGFLFHLLAYLDVDFEIDIDEIDEQSASGPCRTSVSRSW